MNQTNACELFRDDLALVLDGDPTTIERHVEHLSDCDDCRDLRHDARALVTAVSGAGADYRDPSDMFERVMAAVEKEEATTLEANVADVKAKPAAKAATETAKKKAAPAPASARLRSRRTWTAAAIGGGAVALAAGIAIYVAVSAGGGESSVAGLTATVVEVSDTGGAGLGLTIKNVGAEFGPVTTNAVLGAGAIVRTDERTRARLRLSDGSEITLNQGSEVELDGSSARGIRLHAGELVAEIAVLEKGPNAVYATANAKVEVLGTRFLLATSGDFTSVRVSRGLVAFSSAGGRDEVRPGEEGIAHGNTGLEVVPAGHLAEAMSFSEFTAEDVPADGNMAGIGELRAFKPGEKRDRDWKLKVGKQKVTVRIAGNIARTEIEQVFQNDSKTTLEGVYKFPLPSDAKIDRLALDVDGGFEEGAFVDKERAAKIWRGVIQKATARKKQPQGNDIIWVPGPWQDPALLEWQRGGRFELRIFPIPANGARTIKLAYTQVIAPQGQSRRYVYPLAYAKDGSTSVDDFELDVRVDGSDPGRAPRVLGYEASAAIDGAVASLGYKAQKFQPSGNFIVEYTPVQANAELRAWSFRGDVAAAPGENSDSKRGGLDPRVAEEQRAIAADTRPTALLALQPELPRWSEARERDFVFVVDSSHSMLGERSTRMRRLLAAAISEMDRRDRVSVIACDVDCQVMGSESLAPSAKTAADLDAWLTAIEPAGASNLGAAITEATELAAKRQRNGADAWVVLLSDGAASMGFRSAGGLERVAAQALKASKVQISTVGIGSDADDAVLGAVARAGGGHFLPWKAGQGTGEAALALLETTYGVSLENPTIVLPNQMTDIAPASLPTIRAGQEVLVAGRFSGEISGDVILRGTVGGKPFEQRYPLTLKASEARGNAFVPRTWASLEIAKRELEGVADDRPKIVALSKAYGVLSRYTSLLVLESEAMFKAFGVDRTQPSLRWTGEEGAAESVATAGLVDFGGGFGRSRAPGATSKKGKANLADKDFDFDDGLVGSAAESEAPGDEAPQAQTEEKAASSTRAAPRGGGRWMRKVYYKVGSVAKFDTVGASVITAVADAEAAHAKEPDSREAHRDLVQALSFAGQIDRATEVAERWLERDRFDPEALVYLADMLSRSGDRKRGLRLLSGIVDIAPDNASFHERLANAYEQADKQAIGCAHRISAAEILGSDDALAEATRCQRAFGRGDDAAWLLGLATAEVRESAEKKAAEPAADKKRRAQIEVQASWIGGSDLDVSIVTADGVRISWMGGASDIGGSDAMTPGREVVALRRIRSGRYIIEVARSDKSDTSPIDGSLSIKLLGKAQTLPFRLGTADARAQVGNVRVRTESRLESM